MFSGVLVPAHNGNPRTVYNGNEVVTKYSTFTWSKSCFPVVLGWIANSSSASIVVTRTFTWRVKWTSRFRTPHYGNRQITTKSPKDKKGVSYLRSWAFWQGSRTVKSKEASMLNNIQPKNAGFIWEGRNAKFPFRFPVVLTKKSPFSETTYPEGSNTSTTHYHN